MVCLLNGLVTRSHWREKQEQSIWMKSAQFYICGEGKNKKRWIAVRDFCDFSCCPGVVRGRRIRGIRPEEKESSLLTLHCISFWLSYRWAFFFLGGGGGGGDLFLWEGTSEFFPKQWKRGILQAWRVLRQEFGFHIQNRGTVKMFWDYVHQTSLSYNFMV